MKNKWAIVDIQGFKYRDLFIVKEFCLETVNLKFHDVIKSPLFTLNKKTKQKFNWLTINYHGFDWNDGFITLKELRNIVSPILKDSIVYVKGEEKVKWIKQIMNNHDFTCVNIEDLGCDLCLQKKKCPWPCYKHIHAKNPTSAHCAFENVKLLKKWYLLYAIQQKNSNINSDAI